MGSMIFEIKTINQIKQIEYDLRALEILVASEIFFRDIEIKNRNCEYNKRYYFKNREKIIKEKMEYNKTNKNFKENTRIVSRLNYYYKNGYFNDTSRDEAREITKYLINNKLSIKFIPYVSQCLELSKIKII